MNPTTVSTEVKQPAAGFDTKDGYYDPSHSLKGGIRLPTFIEAVNATHLIVVHYNGNVRLIDTTVKFISTLVKPDDNVSEKSPAFYYDIILAAMKLPSPLMKVNQGMMIETIAIWMLIS